MYIQSNKNREGGRKETTGTKVKEVYKCILSQVRTEKGVEKRLELKSRKSVNVYLVKEVYKLYIQSSKNREGG